MVLLGYLVMWSGLFYICNEVYASYPPALWGLLLLTLIVGLYSESKMFEINKED